MTINYWIPLLGFITIAYCLTEYERKVVMESHNKYRQMVAHGEALNIDQKALPSAKNIYKLKYDEEAEKLAQSWADGCVFQHSPQEQRKNAGQSLFAVMPAEKSPEKAVIRATDKWWSELAEFGFDSNDLNFTMEQFNKGIGHWSQLVWAKTNRVGCGVKFCADKPMTYVVCNYFPPGNMINSKIYEVGEPCQKDADCTTHEESTCEQESGLCIAK